MNNETFFWEIKDIITQFIAAFDDVVIKRYNNNREPKESVEVRYVFGPKQRVMYDIVNKAQNLTLPVIAVNTTSISRDNTRVFNKIDSSYLEGKLSPFGPTSTKILSPVPINIEVSFSILARYMSDIDQIISNFVPYTNPYIVLSWTLPEEYNLKNTTEIRSEVLWDGNISYNAPTDLTFSDKFRAVADTSFTIKSWLFKPAETLKTIYKVTANFTNSNLRSKIHTIDDYETLNALYTNISAQTDSVTVSAIPEITNLFYMTDQLPRRIQDPITIKKSISNQFLIYGKRFSYDNKFYLSSYAQNIHSNFTSISTSKSLYISAYKLNENQFSILNDNIAVINLSANALSGSGNQFTFITANSAGWGTSSHGYTITID
jgi:hypothetical protein